MRWSCETAAFRDGPFGKLPFALDSRNVVRCEGGRAPTPPSFAGVPPLPAPLSVPTLKPLSFLLSPPQAASVSARAASAAPRTVRRCMEPTYVRLSGPAIGGPGYQAFSAPTAKLTISSAKRSGHSSTGRSTAALLG